MLHRVQELLAWLNEEYRELSSAYRDYPDDSADYFILYRSTIETLGSAINELEDMIGDEADEDDGQPDDWQENTDFAQDDDFHNQEASDDGFWY